MQAFVIILYILIATTFNQSYKVTTRTMKKAAAQTVGLQLLAGISCLLFTPFFGFKLPSNPWTYLFLGLSCIFYAINNFIIANVRKNLEASVVSILQQSYTVLMTLAGFVLLGEQITLSKVLGILLIVGGNILVFWQSKKTKEIKYIALGLLAYACNVVAGLIDVGHSGEFSLPFYTAFLYFVPALIISICNRVRPSDIAKEYKRANKPFYFLTGAGWGLQYLVLLIAYSMGEVSVVAPLASLTVISNVIVGYFLLKEKSRIVRKIIAAILAISGIILISL
ncbi:EamA family transporter [Candidatus Saccharibacteria bacterium]|nr:EamA family transporter [Candidatus Saccharibacteria bacterium]